MSSTQGRARSLGARGLAGAGPGPIGAEVVVARPDGPDSRALPPDGTHGRTRRSARPTTASSPWRKWMPVGASRGRISDQGRRVQPATPGPRGDHPVGAAEHRQHRHELVEGLPGSLGQGQPHGAQERPDQEPQVGPRQRPGREVGEQEHEQRRGAVGAVHVRGVVRRRARRRECAAASTWWTTASGATTTSWPARQARQQRSTSSRNIGERRVEPTELVPDVAPDEHAGGADRRGPPDGGRADPGRSRPARARSRGARHGRR